MEIIDFSHGKRFGGTGTNSVRVTNLPHCWTRHVQYICAAMPLEKSAGSYFHYTMASIRWMLLLFLAQLHTALATSSAHHADGGNLTHLLVPILCHPDQAKALLQLKESFSFGESTTKLPSWRDGTDCCLWEGIGCESSSGQVTVLDLKGCGLSSKGLDPALFGLTSLRRLDLSMNSFNGGTFLLRDNIAAAEFERFTLLTHLNLSNSGFYGQIPTGISKLVNLISLDLSSSIKYEDGSNELHVSNFDTLVANLSKLRELYLDRVNLSSSGDNWCISIATSLPHLQGSMSSSNFKSLKELGSLRRLDLSFNSVGELGPIFSWIGEHKNLRSLVLFQCDFSMTTPSSVSNFKALRSLTMVECKLPRSIISAIGNLMELQTLVMEYCTTYGSMPSSIGNLTNLRNMHIIQCGFSGAMPAAIGNLINLRTLQTYYSFTGTIPYAVGELKKLTWLVLQGNFSERIPGSLVNLAQLTKLDLSENHLTGEIPSSVFTLPVLRDLDLSGNKLSGPIREFKAPLQLHSINLRDNELSGPIPKVFFHLTSLKYLDVSSNNFTGLVNLNSFWRLRDLDSLVLSNNKLCVIDGEGNSPLSTYLAKPTEIGLASCNITRFPRSLMLMKRISFLDLSYNKIDGDIPNWLWETCSGSLVSLDLSHNMFTGLQLTSDVLPLATDLDSLDLSFNRLQGQIPMSNSSAEFLDYSGNRFSSVPPNFTLYLRYTKKLNVSNNSINGHIPISICNSSLNVLDLSHNNFSGLIPSCLIENDWLEVLNLRENNLEGMSLPSNITTRCSLQMIDLYANKIEGQLPRGLSNCPNLEVLNFGSNQIADTFPSWLRGLSKLSVIILRSNRFYGTIGDIVGDIKSEEFFPSLHILDLASNSFSSDLKPQWLKLLKSMMKFNSTGNDEDFLYFADSIEYYQDSIQIMYKGSYMPFEEVWTTLTVIDFSNNRLQGTIPESIGRLKSLRVLNLPHNAFTGRIPTQLGGMTVLESLDLSCNQLSGDIPQELTDLTFLDSLNLSNNHLVGKIPQAHQFSTFDSSSFEGNAGLCGPPLSKLPCGDSPYTPGVPDVHKSDHHVDVVLFLFVGVGYGVGFAAAILVNWRRIGRWFVATARASRT
ncbi:hypothetical protein ACP70R_002891 [Stipagrostis hirtigluma subsp. patula]